MKAVAKSFDILELMNRRALTSLAELHLETGIPKPTIIRILNVLATRGYVEQAAKRGAWRLAAEVTSLSAGYHGAPAIVALAKTAADRLTGERLWPVSLAVLDRDAMVVRYSTIPQSPLAHVASTLNKRLSLVARAHGRAYLAFCPPAERTALLVLAGRSGNPEDALAGAAETLQRGLGQIRRRGYATRLPKLTRETETIAVPIMRERHVFATMGMTFFRRAVSAGEQEALATLLAATAREIANALPIGWPETARASPGRS
jgi:IclR family mhp operon transcriptional activator